VSHKSLLPKILDSIDQDATLYTDTSKLYTDINYYVMRR